MHFASTVLMIKPTSFGFNIETSKDNVFQKQNNRLSNQQIQLEAEKESRLLRDKLIDSNINVIYAYENCEHNTPDAVFPNNWFSTHDNDTLVLYPMLAANRRKERNAALINYLKNSFQIKEVVDMTPFENENKFLEGTGSLVFDHKNKICFASISERTNTELANNINKKLGYQTIILNYTDENNTPVYHTNVCMCIGNGFVIAAIDNLKSKSERTALFEYFETNNLNPILISQQQVYSFCGNALQLQTNTERPVLTMSTTAFNAFSTEQIKTIEKHSDILYSSIDTIESIGGGSVRCMLAEIFLNPKS